MEQADCILSIAALRAVEAAVGPTAQPPLMERAGAAAARQVFDILAQRSGCVLILAGPGNNGGDGFVLARHLVAAGCEVVVACLADLERLPPDAKKACQDWIATGGSVVSDFVGSQWVLAVDALLGIGVSRPLEGRMAEWVERLNALTCPVLALDIPSGLDADTGSVLGVAVRATHTASFIALKPGLLTRDGPDHCGRITQHSLDVDSRSFPAGGSRLSTDSFASCLQPRQLNSHKGSFGEAGVIGGASGMVGAALLSSRAALRLGAGRVYTGLLDAQAPVLDICQPELMLRSASDVFMLSKVIAIGPGLGKSDSAQTQLRRALAHAGPVVFDADALSILAEHTNLQALLTQRTAATVLTPHPAEAARLLHCSVAELQADRLAAALELARRFKAHVVLKGVGSIVADPDGAWGINASGNPGLASAGTGDVLTGFVLALLAQGWPANKALRCAVHLHGVAADELVAQGIGPVGLVAGELADAARATLNRWIRQAQR